MVDIEYNKENVQRCLCPGCPVQATNECIQEKINKIKSQKGGVPSIDDFPGVYCGTGKSRCEDLDENQPCQCDKCEVWKEYDLNNAEISYYYCVDGKAR